MVGTFPADIPTAITKREAAKLADLADGGVVLELGAHYGFSTIVLAATAAHVVSIDWHEGDNNVGSLGSSYTIYMANLVRYGVAGRVAPVVRRFEDVLPEMAAVQASPIFDGCFIDGEHEEESVRRDLSLVLPLMKPGGWLALHDYGGAYVGVKRVADEFGIEGVIDTLAWGFA
jgi:predicted O-methyltransferase YrrM